MVSRQPKKSRGGEGVLNSKCLGPKVLRDPWTKGEKFRPRALGHIGSPWLSQKLLDWEVSGGGPKLFRRESRTLKGAHIPRPQILGCLGSVDRG